MAWWIVMVIVSQAPAVEPVSRLVSATNVRVRAAPSADAGVVTTVPFGTGISALGRDPRGWIRVRTPAGDEGWMAVGLTRVVPAGRRDSLAEAIVEWRLRRTGDSVATWREVLAFVDREREQSADHERHARLTLLRLQTLRRALQAVPFGGARRDPAIAAWLSGHKEEVVYNEPGGQWMLRRNVIFAEADRHAGTASAEALASLAAENGLPGECEGDLPCYFTRINLLEGEFLRRHPEGVHLPRHYRALLLAGDSLRRILDMPGFFTRAQCPALLQPVDALYDAVAVAGDPEPGLRLQVLDRLDEFRIACAGATPGLRR